MKTLLALLTVVGSFAFAADADAGWWHRRHFRHYGYGYPAYYAPAPAYYAATPVVSYYRPVSTCYRPVWVAPPVVAYRPAFYPAYRVAPGPYYYGW